jgi:hypothetical protein
MKVRNRSTQVRTKAPRNGLSKFSLGKLEISTEEILADLRYPSAPARDRRR